MARKSSRLRWFQFRLRTLLLLPAVFVVPWWWVTWPQRTARRFVSAMSAGRYRDAQALWNGKSDEFADACARQWKGKTVKADSRRLGYVFLGNQSFTIEEYTSGQFVPGSPTFTIDEDPANDRFVVRRGRVIAFKKAYISNPGPPPGPPGWEEFYSAVEYLFASDDRAVAAKRFREVVQAHPDAPYDILGFRGNYSREAQELADLLEVMAKEDASWIEPSDPEKLGLDERIRYLIYHLRDVNVYQETQPGMCYVLDTGFFRPSTTYNWAIDLHELGQAAVPALIALLDDRRPIRSVGFHRVEAPFRTVLRYQDAAIQILGELLPVDFYVRSSSGAYLSNESAEDRERVIGTVRRWYEESKGKPAVPQPRSIGGLGVVERAEDSGG